ncbi:MAG: tRNA preQ1(34) S-adenosylmethionine ribosyltransferase-isomerase QueA [Pseudomonadota bacterium]
MYSLSDYDYHLPTELIAQKPADRRDGSRLLLLDRATGRYAHRHFSDVTDYLKGGDVLVVNNTRVVPGRLYGHKPSGGTVEALVLNHLRLPTAAGDTGFRDAADCLIKASKPCKPGLRIDFGNLTATVAGGEAGRYTLNFETPDGLGAALEAVGYMPLPPYIRRSPDKAPPCDDRSAYQTVYARESGAVAAPTAGLHFTEALMGAIREKGVTVLEVTLHVGMGTFAPVRVDDIRTHRMHAETFHIASDVAAAVNQAKREGRRIVAVGTTSVRTLETAARETGHVIAGSGESDLFIYPGFSFRVVDAMITNFHLPQSTLMMLVSAFAGRDLVLAAYAEAVRLGYRFFSYGDAMMIV